MRDLPILLIWLDFRSSVKVFTATVEQIDRWQRRVPELKIIHARSQEEFVRNLAKATYIFTFRFSEAWLPLTYRAKWLATPAAGQELLGCRLPERIRLTQGTFHGKLISETVLGMLLALRRGLLPGLGLCSPEQPWPEELQGKCGISGSSAVILGYGHIGQQIGHLLEAVGVHVSGINHRNFSTLETLLPTSDALILALPATSETNHIIDASLLTLLPRHAVLINIGRGNAIDESALCSALNANQIYAAFLDVAHEEPYPSAGLLLHTPHCFLLPHVSGVAPDYLDQAFEEWIDLYHRDYCHG